MKMYANLHLHTTHSDGKYSPEEIVDIAKKEGYKAIAVTDHDTATAFPFLKEACGKNDMECIFGVEFSVWEEDKIYHLVGFNFNPEYKPMAEYLKKMALRQTDNTLCCFNEAVEKGGIKGVTWEEVLEYNKGIDWLCNEHVFNLLKSKGLENDQGYIKWFDDNFRYQRGKYPPKYRFNNLKEMTELIHDAGGITVLAHPNSYKEDIKEILKKGFDGVEVWHSEMKERDREYALKLALENNMYISGGSDHEGLCGGFYSAFKSEEELINSRYYVPKCSCGTTKEYYEEIKNMKINR